MKLAYIMVAYALSSAPFAVAAADTTPPVDAATGSAAKPAKDPNRLICKSEDETGSMIAKHKICLTTAQWRQRAFNAGQWAEHQTTYNSQPNGH